MLSILSIAVDFKKLGPWLPTFWEGTMVTVVLSLATVLLGTIIGLLATVLQQSENKFLKGIANVIHKSSAGRRCYYNYFYGYMVFH